MVTADPAGRTAGKAQVVLWLPAAAYKAKAAVVASAQPMGNLFEQALADPVRPDRRGARRKVQAVARHRNVE